MMKPELLFTAPVAEEIVAMVTFRDYVYFCTGYHVYRIKHDADGQPAVEQVGFEKGMPDVDA